MTSWTGNVSIVLLAAIPLLIVGYRRWRQRNRRLAGKANVDDYKNTVGALHAWRPMVAPGALHDAV